MMKLVQLTLVVSKDLPIAHSRVVSEGADNDEHHQFSSYDFLYKDLQHSREKQNKREQHNHLAFSR